MTLRLPFRTRLRHSIYTMGKQIMIRQQRVRLTTIFGIVPASSKYVSTDKIESYGDVAFFVMDTRRHRSLPSDAEGGQGTMLGETQLAALHTWLSEVSNAHIYANNATHTIGTTA